MAIGKDSVTVNIEIDIEVKELLKDLSKKLEISVSSLANNLILISLNDFNFMKKTGFFFIGKHLKDVLEKGLNIKMKGHPKCSSENTDFISVTMKKDTKELLDQYANELELPVKKLVRNFIYTTLDDHDFLSKTGLMKIAFRFRKLLESDKEFEKLQESKKQRPN